MCGLNVRRYARCVVAPAATRWCGHRLPPLIVVCVPVHCSSFYSSCWFKSNGGYCKDSFGRGRSFYAYRTTYFRDSQGFVSDSRRLRFCFVLFCFCFVIMGFSPYWNIISSAAGHPRVSISKFLYKYKLPFSTNRWKWSWSWVYRLANWNVWCIRVFIVDILMWYAVDYDVCYQ